MKTFKCDFGKGVGCEIHVADEAPQKGEAHIRKVEWTGKPTAKVFRPYIAWINSVNKTLADEWGVRLMHLFQMGPRLKDCEIWVYEPGKRPERKMT